MRARCQALSRGVGKRHTSGKDVEIFARVIFRSLAGKTMQIMLPSFPRTAASRARVRPIFALLFALPPVGTRTLAMGDRTRTFLFTF